MSGKNLSVAVPAAMVLIVAQTAWGHPGHSHGGFTGGIVHPFSGLDHLLAMLAVGLFAAQIGGRALWLLPTVFLGSMVVGGAVAIGGRPVPMLEQGIAASVLILGLMVFAGARLNLVLAAGLIGLFAVFHGYAHGSEMVIGSAFVEYAVGFTLATATLIAIGVGVGRWAMRHDATGVARFAGGAITVAGALMLVV